MRTVAIQTFAALCLFVGLVTLWLPIPTGLVLIAIGLALLLTTSPRVVRWLALLRRRYPGFDRRLARIEPFLPVPLRRALARTATLAAKDMKT